MPSFRLTPPRVALVDPRTGLIDRAWYLFFLSLNNDVTAADNSNTSPDSMSSMLSYDAMVAGVAQTAQTQPVSVDFGMQQQIDGLQLAVSNATSQIAELQKTIDAMLMSAQIDIASIPTNCLLLES